MAMESEKMEFFEDLYVDDLLALRQLYVLLLNRCHSDSALQQQLDERAQILFKHLLDNATARLFEARSQDQKAKAISEIYPPLSEVKNFTQGVSNFSSSFSIKPEQIRKKQCRISTLNSLKHQNLDKPDNEVVTISGRDCGHQDVSTSLPDIDKLDEKVVSEWIECNQSRRNMMGNSEIEENPSPISMARSSTNNDLSFGIGLAIRQIEFQLLSLQRCSNNTNRGDKLANSQLESCKLKTRCKPINVRGCVESRNGASKTKNSSELVVHGFRIPMSPDNEASKIPTVETQKKLISKANKTVVNTMVVLKDECRKVESSLPPRSVGRSKAANSDRNLTGGRMIMRPTLLEHTSRGGLRMSMKNVKIERERESHKNQHQSDQSELDENSESTFSSSSWTTQQNSSETNYHTSSSSTGSEEISSSISTQYRNPSPKKILRFSHGNGNGSKKATGRLRRLKNLIFHHHHHHHHHHHNDHDNFMWKHLRKIFHGTEKKMVTSSKECGDHRKLKKSLAIKKVSKKKNEVGKFQALAQGLRSHVWKSKAMKKKNKGLGHRKKGVKKLHWWQMFHRHRGVKLPSKGRVKIGYVNRKTQLKMV